MADRPFNATKLPAGSENDFHLSIGNNDLIPDISISEIKTGGIWAHGPGDPHFMPTSGPIRNRPHVEF